MAIKRKYKECAMCGKTLTTEHHFSKYCHECKARIEYEVEVHKAIKEPEFKPFELSPQFIDVRYKDISLGITCPECGYQVDANSKMQDWEIKCDACKLLFTVDVVVRVNKFA